MLYTNQKTILTNTLAIIHYYQSVSKKEASIQLEQQRKAAIMHIQRLVRRTTKFCRLQTQAAQNIQRLFRGHQGRLIAQNLNNQRQQNVADHAPLAQALIQAQRHNAIQRIQRFIRRQQQRPIQAVGNLNMQQPPDQAIQIPQLQVNQIQAPQINNQQRHQLRQENEHRDHFDLMGAEDIFEEPIIQKPNTSYTYSKFL